MENGWLFGMTLAALFLFGALYNLFVAWLVRTGRDRGATAILVVGGTLSTLLGAAAIIGLEHTAVALACFAASGLPMVIGSWERYTRKRAQDEQTAKELAWEMLHDQTERGRVRDETGNHSSA